MEQARAGVLWKGGGEEEEGGARCTQFPYFPPLFAIPFCDDVGGLGGNRRAFIHCSNGISEFFFSVH